MDPPSPPPKAPVSRSVLLTGEGATMALGASLRQAGLGRGAVYLEGDLGTGKTTLVRGFLRAWGVEGAIRSPTFTLVEIYRIGAVSVAHFDLYRLSDPEELEYLGLRDLVAGDALTFFEWPENGLGVLPEPALAIRLEHAFDAAETAEARRARCVAFEGGAGGALVRALPRSSERFSEYSDLILNMNKKID